MKHCCKEQAEHLNINMYSCHAIAGNIFSVSAHAVNKLSTKTIFFAKTKSTLRPPPPQIPTFCNISRQIPFSFQFSSSKIIMLRFCLNSRLWIFDFSFSESGTSTCSPIYPNSKDTPNFCENSEV